MDFENFKNKRINDVSRLIETGRYAQRNSLVSIYKEYQLTLDRKKYLLKSIKKSALASAKESKQRAKVGLRRGILDGIPISVKDLAI